MSPPSAPKRRFLDTLTQDELNSLNAVTISLIHDDLREIKTELVTVKEILVAWNNAKGFVKTVKLVGDIVKWGSPVVVAILTTWYFFFKR